MKFFGHDGNMHLTDCIDVSLFDDSVLFSVI